MGTQIMEEETVKRNSIEKNIDVKFIAGPLERDKNGTFYSEGRFFYSVDLKNPKISLIKIYNGRRGRIIEILGKNEEIYKIESINNIKIEGSKSDITDTKIDVYNHELDTRIVRINHLNEKQSEQLIQSDDIVKVD